MEETSETLLTQTASHPLLLQKEAEEILLMEVEVEKEIMLLQKEAREDRDGESTIGRGEGGGGGEKGPRAGCAKVLSMRVEILS